MVDENAHGPRRCVYVDLMDSGTIQQGLVRRCQGQLEDIRGGWGGKASSESRIEEHSFRTLHRNLEIAGGPAILRFV